MNHSTKLLHSGQALLESGELKSCGVLFQDGRIIKLLPEDQNTTKDVERIDCTGKLIAPGLIDTHVHGAYGRNFMEGTPDAVAAISDFLVKGGTTSCLATTTSASPVQQKNALIGLSDISRNPKDNQVEILGIHLEGPFISTQNHGAHIKSNIRAAYSFELECIYDAAQGSLKIVTLAPETSYAMEAIDFFVRRGVHVSIGHTMASFEQTQKALQAGVTRGTHIFNGMPQIHHRQPGAVVALLLNSSVFLEMTVDGEHLAPAIIELVLKVAGPERCILITDGTDVRGLGDGNFQRWEGTHVIIQDGRAKTLNGTLAGSMLSQSEAVRNLIHLANIPVGDAIRMASENPARSIGVFDRKGSISPGKDADFVIFNPDLTVHMTIVRGNIVYKGD